ncbi:UDP-3-O-(3-hydroxymyristoyl)glucosamine N-acyltransferase [Rhizobium sp. EC-SD404]|uniref:UDP-3-O-(3-hydroxymyristoyl)glucosamine N-acyltransferase n=1 Tax=Rhizobium sp. EC-SD404 TaxID=2038389 RepID=UPI0012589910|nr:UDP-3-O-(3-hydroxymyristoyl)glucosamine N-acyltransferase [Rhizobium sp. EC-SD404]VVT18925.1 UDP-3-O-acylglucosamine N-acyltransferase [Rhizobium sp. EC-SD404]
MDRPIFFPPHRGIPLGQLAADIGAELHDPRLSDRLITSVAPLSRADIQDLTFITSRRHAEMLIGLKAGAIVCHRDMAPSVPENVAALLAPAPQSAFARAAALLYPSSMRPLTLTNESGISPKAYVHPGAHLEPGVVVDVSAVVGDGAEIGSGTIIGAAAVIGPGCKIGRNCSIGPNTTVQCSFIGNDVIIHPGARIGQDGFGYAPSPSGMLKIPQLGRVIIQDRVEIGANTAVDRGAMDDTVIGEGTKIDNLVQVGHNVRVGRHCVIVGQVAIAGSVTIGDQVMIGGGTTIAGHLQIGAGAQIAGMSAVAADVPGAARWGGIPARPMRAFLRDMAEIRARAFNRSPKNVGVEPDE